MTNTPHPALPPGTGEAPGKNFIRAKILQDRSAGRFSGSLQTRFPPEPNGYLHLGHAKSICLNFGLAEEFGGRCNLRFDDTNPLKESREYVDAIRADVRWLGFDWEDREYYASDYFEQLYAFAEKLILMDKAYVDSQSAEEIRENRGTLTRPGAGSPYRDRSVTENLDLFRRMRAGEFPDGAHVLRAKIDMASPNIIMRDPTLYRIRHAEHHRTQNRWCIYPMYDFTHCISDALEKVTHSLCTLEFVNNRELYNWTLETLNLFRSEQTEFARLSISRTVLSKRKLIQLVNEGHVSGWDDPRMPTLSGLRRRGIPPEAIRNFCARIGISRADNVVEYGFLEFCAREILNRTAKRAMAVLDPLKIIVENYPHNRTEWFHLPLFPDDPEKGTRPLPFSREIWIERSDFREDAPGKFHRLTPGREVRLRCAYYITCTAIHKDESGNILSLVCSYDPRTRGGGSPDNRKVKGTLHWVSAAHAVPAAIRLYDDLFLQDDPETVPEGKTFLDVINPDSLRTVTARMDPSLAALPPGERVQFERLGYFCVDPDSTPCQPVFNRIVAIKDTWAKLEKRISPSYKNISLPAGPSHSSS
ncbi:MAG: glutamine--tRNA ligase/YqeY domain fusion protein [Desulfovibrio sp.]|jgi:glutaminyl-tRNA synthetase|nr:glutamine--tRNA ligase/YqeY domain fusion protein [Desulfovibrio sp.]